MNQILTMHFAGKLVGCTAFCFLAGGRLQAQASADSMLIAAIAHTQQLYHQFVFAAAPVYAGPQYVDYQLQLHDGHPFLQYNHFVAGSVLYDHILYEHLPLKYDLLIEKIVTKDPTGVYTIMPDVEKIEYFTLQDHEYFRIGRDSNHVLLPGRHFYEKLYTDNRFTLYKKENKRLDEEINNSGLRRLVYTNINYYLAIGQTYYPFSSEKQVLAVFKDRRKEIKQFMRQQLRSDDTIDRGILLMKTIAYYNSLGK